MESLDLPLLDNLHERVNGVSAEDVYDMLVDECQLLMPFGEWLELKFTLYCREAKQLQYRKGALEVYQNLEARGVLQAVVSNSDRMIVDVNLRAVNFQRPKLCTVSRNDVRRGKPNPEPYLRGAWLLGVAPEETVVVEDSVVGACAGIAAGMRTLYWPEVLGSSPTPEGAELIDSEQALYQALCG